MNKLEEKIKNLIEKFKKIENSLLNVSDAKDLIKLSKERSSIDDVVREGKIYINKIEELKKLEENISSEKDLEMLDLMKDEIGILRKEIPYIEETLKFLLIPQDPSDEGNAILEIRAGTGGDEAGIFAGDLLRMYEKFAELKGWKCEIIEINKADAGGIKVAVLEITGKKVYGQIRFESGTHRVQRIPLTETQGRVHTSAATVAVFPETSELEIDIKPTDLRVDVYRSSGAGGQHVNTTESAVRMTHLPTGLVVEIQDGRSQLKNREKALSVIRAKVFEYEEKKRNDALASDRKAQVGSGDRSEKIRTYNFPQNRLTDHRIGFTSHNLDKIIVEGRLESLIEALRVDYNTKKMLNSKLD